MWVCVCVREKEREGEGDGERGRRDDGTGEDWFKLFFLPRFVRISTQIQPSFVRAQLSFAAGCLLAHSMLVT